MFDVLKTNTVWSISEEKNFISAATFVQFFKHKIQFTKKQLIFRKIPFLKYSNIFFLFLELHETMQSEDLMVPIR